MGQLVIFPWKAAMFVIFSVDFAKFLNGIKVGFHMILP